MDYTKQSDYQLLCRIKKGNMKALHEMHRRYERLFIKQRINLEKKCREMGLSVDVGDYSGMTYQAFLNAMNTMDVNRISEPKQNWGAWIVINGYLRSKNRDIIHDLIKYKQHNLPLDDGSKHDEDDRTKRGIAKTESVEHEYIRKETTRPFWNAVELSVNGLNAQQKQIWEMLSNNVKKSEICDTLNIDGNLYKQELAYIRDVFKRNLQYKMKTMDTSELRSMLTA